MQEAMKSLRRVVELIEEEKVGTTVLMPINEAALVLGISGDNLRRMGERRQELGISVIDERVEVKLYGGVSERRMAYQFLYGVIQNSLLGTAPEFLATQEIPPSLKEEFPGIEEIANVIKGGVLPDLDLGLLNLHLGALWQGLRDKEGLYPPEQALTSVAY